MNRFRNALVDIASFAISFIIQDRMVDKKIINIDNLLIDFLSYLVIFAVVYLILSTLFKKKKNVNYDG